MLHDGTEIIHFLTQDGMPHKPHLFPSQLWHVMRTLRYIDACIHVHLQLYKFINKKKGYQV